MREILFKPIQMSENQKKGFLVVTPILIGSVVYGISVFTWVGSHFFGMFF